MLVPAEPVEGAVGVDDVGGIEVLNGEGACIGELDVGLIEASAFLEVFWRRVRQ